MNIDPRTLVKSVLFFLIFLGFNIAFQNASNCDGNAKIYYINSIKTDVPNCGKSEDTACASFNYFKNFGCDGAGCKTKIVGGDIIEFKSGTYKSQLAVNFESTSNSSPLTIRCANPGTCTIDGNYLTAENNGSLYGGVIDFRGLSQFTKISGFKIINIPSSLYGIHLDGTAKNILIENNTIDGTGAQKYLTFSEAGTELITFSKNRLMNCPGGNQGCLTVYNGRRWAIVNNQFGPVGTNGNNDCSNLVDSQSILVDGNTCSNTVDGFDQGMGFNHSVAPIKLDNIITRYNWVFGNVNGRAFPISGDYSTGISDSHLTGTNVIYNNVAQISGGNCFEPYEGAQNITFAYNTCFNYSPKTQGFLVHLQSGWDKFIQRINLYYNIFDAGPDASGSKTPPIWLSSTSGAISCPSNNPCPFVANAFGMNDRGASDRFADWNPSNYSSKVYSFGEISGPFQNVNSNSRNIWGDPRLVNRTPSTTLSNLALQSNSSLVGAAKPFCTATSGGSNSTSINLNCSPFGSPKYIFPSPENYYRLSNETCTGGGVRNSNSGGCYTIQIEGCGVRQALQVTDTSITLDQPCSWQYGAGIHVPWSPSAPNIGAL